MTEWKNENMNNVHESQILLLIVDHTNRRCSELVKPTPEHVPFTTPEKLLVRLVKGLAFRSKSKNQDKKRIKRIFCQKKSTWGAHLDNFTYKSIKYIALHQKLRACPSC